MNTSSAPSKASTHEAHRRCAMSASLALAAAVVLSGCAVAVPSQVQPVRDFDVQRYAGTWYELARIEHRFERGLINTSAQYSLNPDGTVVVINRGFNPEKNEWKEVRGEARFIGDPRTAALKVSFFRPFYGGYNVVRLSEDYKTALVIGSSLDYFWLLSREKSIPDRQRKELLAEAERIGVNVKKVRDVPQR